MRFSKFVSCTGFLAASAIVAPHAVTAHPAHGGASVEARALVHDPDSNFKCTDAQKTELDRVIKQTQTILLSVVERLKISDPEYLYWMDPTAEPGNNADKQQFEKVKEIYQKALRVLLRPKAKTGSSLEVNCMPEEEENCVNVYAYIMPGKTSNPRLRSDSLNLCPWFWQPQKPFLPQTTQKEELEFEWPDMKKDSMSLRGKTTGTQFNVCDQTLRNQFGYWSEVVVKPMVLIHELTHARVWDDNVDKLQVGEQRALPPVAYDCAYGAFFSKWLTSVNVTPKISFANAENYAFLAFGWYMRNVICGNGNIFTQDDEVTFVPRFIQPLGRLGQLKTTEAEQACNPQGIGRAFMDVFDKTHKNV